MTLTGSEPFLPAYGHGTLGVRAYALAGPGSLLTALGTTRQVAEILDREGGAQRPWW